MGNGVSHCFTSPGPPRHRRRRHPSSTAAVSSLPLDDGLGHSFCYLSSSTTTTSTSTSAFPLSLSGASVSANTSTPLSTSLSDDPLSQHPAAFDSSNRFSSLPLQPAPISGPLSSSGFLSGPIERSLFSAPLTSSSSSSNPNKPSTSSSNPLKRTFSQSKTLLRAIRRTVGAHAPRFHPKSPPALRSQTPADDDVSSLYGDRLQWAQGKAGEDRVHVVVSEEHGWAFVGIYDGFNGPDATDFLQTYLYPAVEKEVKGLVWERSDEVLKALAAALRKTEDTFFDCADMMATENPELALMGSCVLVMLMKGEDVYLMNVGDSRAVLAQKKDLERISEESLGDDELLNLGALQLTLDHSTSVKEEVVRIRSEHPEDNMAIANARVKGSLKVTRAFGAGFLKQPKWNDALLEMFRIDYIGKSPYITCNPSLYHHRVGVRDRFLILSSDGLYQYFTNEEVVAEVELFIATTPEGDPAQHLVEEMLFRAARKAGMDFHELLEIPQGDRRRYHDDVSIIVISLEGRIWRSCV